MDREDVKPVIEILAKQPRTRTIREIAIGRRNDADVDLRRALGADGIDLSFLQRAQQLDLHVEAKLADLVEEQSSSISFLELAKMFVGRAGERAFLMTEKNR